MVYDHLQTECSTLHEFKIEKELVVSAKSARSRYHAALEATKGKEKEEARSRKRKKLIEDIEAVKQKKMHIESCISSLEKDIVKHTMEAEETSDLTILSKAKSFRKTVASKNTEVVELDKVLLKMEKEKKQIK